MVLQQTALNSTDNSLSKPYGIFFFAPGQCDWRLAEFELDQLPFPISVGDLIDARGWNSADLGEHGVFYRVRALEHKLIDLRNGNVRQMLGVHMEELTESEYLKIAIGDSED
jgi:hypothetical protein